jgi:hypothetical protein
MLTATHHGRVRVIVAPAAGRPSGQPLAGREPRGRAARATAGEPPALREQGSVRWNGAPRTAGFQPAVPINATKGAGRMPAVRC